MSGWFILTIVTGVLMIIGIIAGIIWRKREGDSPIWLFTITTILIFLFLFFILVGTIALLTAKNELAEYIEKSNMIQQVIENGGNIENTGINNAIIEYNDWLVKVKVSKQRYGIFSQYYYIDISDMEYFVLQ